MSKHAHHGFTHTHIEHHADGSHTIHHHHHATTADKSHDVKHAVQSLDGAHDSMQDHLGAPNPGEVAANAGQHGVAPPEAAAAGLPVPGAVGA